LINKTDINRSCSGEKGVVAAVDRCGGAAPGGAEKGAAPGGGDKGAAPAVDRCGGGGQ